MISEKKKASNYKWNKENMVKVGVNIRRDYAEQIKQKAADEGTTVHAIIKAALDAYMDAPAPLASEQEDE